MCQDLTLARLKHSIVDAGLATAVVMLIIMASSVVGWILTFEQLPAAFVTLVQTTLGEKWMIILAMNFIMLAIGMFIDLPAAGAAAVVQLCAGADASHPGTRGRSSRASATGCWPRGAHFITFQAPYPGQSRTGRWAIKN